MHGIFVIVMQLLLGTAT